MSRLPMNSLPILGRRRLLTAGLGAGVLAAGALTAGVLPVATAARAESPAALESLSPDQVSALSRVERYLNDINTMQARFVQISSNGGYAEGEVFVDRPGHMRFDYDPPTPVLLIANGLTMLYYDKELKEATFLPIWEKPLWFLIREEVRFDENVEIVAIEEALGTLRVSLRDPDNPDGGTVTLVFTDRPLTLRRWQLLDPQGIETQVSLVNPIYGEAVDDELFKYHHLEIHNRVRRDR